MPLSLLEISDALKSALPDLALLTEVQLSRCETLANNEKISLEKAIVKLGLLDETRLLEEAAKHYELEFHSEPLSLALDLDLLKALTPQYCKAKCIAPVQTDSGEVLVLVSDPGNATLRDELAFHMDTEPTLGLGTSHSIQRLLSQALAKNEPAETAFTKTTDADVEFLRQESMDGPVIRFVSQMLTEAVHRGASDIHIESEETGLRIRFREQGLLLSEPFDHALNPTSVLARIKVLAAMNVAERRLPQDGRITITVAGRKIDFRVSTIPTSFGESAVLRVLDPASLKLGWDKLGFEPIITEQIVSAIERPSGLFLVTGPTGSGKTTTLYTALSHLSTESVKIVTIEDPVEYVLPGVQQVQVNEPVGMTFSKALRSFLRQDPNIIMVGEIRDEETAEIACRAALVGRMVLSTLHTSSPEGAFARLQDLGVPEYLIRDVLVGVLGQELMADGRQGRRLTAKYIGQEKLSDL